MTPATIDTLLAAVQRAGVEAEQMHEQHPESDVLDQVRLDLGHIYELVRFEADLWRKTGGE